MLGVQNMRLNNSNIIHRRVLILVVLLYEDLILKFLSFGFIFFLRIDVNSKTFKILIQAREGNKYQLSSFHHSVLLEKLKFRYMLNT